MKNLLAVLVGLCLEMHGCNVLADARRDERMMQIATSAGCMMCHGMTSYQPAPGGMPPTAPSWLDIADHYRGQAHAGDKLLAVVMGGSSVYGSHWEDKVSGTVMPPNAIPISERDARQLIDWILGLKRQPKSGQRAVDHGSKR
jgi:cytochrome c